MLISCNNKKCMQQTDALLDPNTLEVICAECGKVITDVSEPMKRTLKSFGQILRSNKKAFVMACKTCNANREILLDDNNNTVCSICHGEIKVHAAMKQAIMEAGRKVSSLEKSKEEKEEEKPKTRKPRVSKAK